MAGWVREATVGKISDTWRKKIDVELFNNKVPPQKDRSQGARRSSVATERKGSNSDSSKEYRGRWNPSEEFPFLRQRSAFFGAMLLGDGLDSREEFARAVIEELLEGYPEDHFEITGDIMDDTDAHNPGQGDSNQNSSEDISKLARAVMAGVPDEPDDENDQNIGDGEGPEDQPARDIGAQARSILTAGEITRGPPLNPCVKYLRLKKCGEYGRDKATVWKSPFWPHLDNREGRKGLLDHQVTAIVWLLSRFLGSLPVLSSYLDLESLRMRRLHRIPDESRTHLQATRYFGGILADSMGLGKTLTTVAFIELLLTHRILKNINRLKNGDSKPILLIAPNPAVGKQWLAEIMGVIDPLIVSHIFLSGPGLDTDTCHRDIRDCGGPRGRTIVYISQEEFISWPLEYSWVWDIDDSRASQAIFIVTMGTWAHRTCKTDEFKFLYSEYTTRGRAFSLVIVDEAHKVKNHNTKNWHSVSLIQRDFTLLITATPVTNSVSDLFALGRLLWPEPEAWLKDKLNCWNVIENKFSKLEDLHKLPVYPSWHQYRLAACRPAVLAKLLHKSEDVKMHSINQIREYLQYFEQLAILKRSPSTILYGDFAKTIRIPLDGLYPNVKTYTVEISTGIYYDCQYQDVHVDLLRKYLRNLQNWRGVSVGPQARTTRKSVVGIGRQFQIASSSLDVYDLNQIIMGNGRDTKVGSIRLMREHKVDVLRLVPLLAVHTDGLGGKGTWKYQRCLEIVTRNSPILRYILRYVRENILTRKAGETIKKLMILEASPIVAFYYELVLQFVGFDCRCMHGGLSPEQRQKLVDSFNSRRHDSCQILIQMYSVGFAGTNLHYACSRVLVASQAHSMQVQMQAIHRVIRIGQRSDVTVHRVKFKNSYHAFVESRQIEKIIPELGTRANGDGERVLVQLLNHFQYEVRNAWNSPEGQQLLEEMDLLADDPVDMLLRLKTQEEEEEGDGGEGPGTQKRSASHSPQREASGGNGSTVAQSKSMKTERNDDVSRHLLPGRRTNAPNAPNDEGARTPAPRHCNGERGWLKRLDSSLSDAQSFLRRRTRNAYYKEFINLPRQAKASFSHKKNNLRRLLTFGHDGSRVPRLRTKRWEVSDLDKSSVLERALELMLRVRIAAGDFAMLPLPTCDVSLAEPNNLQRLRDLLAGVATTHQDVEEERAVVKSRGLDNRQELPNVDLSKSFQDIERQIIQRDMEKPPPTDHGSDDSSGDSSDDDDNEDSLFVHGPE
ncbi:P-loop containing nucleoside triphosphate hydrolase protein [Xylaria sp. CBS 124048]|nr:P-loop containing nucleoside triphosphate hydrolase protein [Xylaria sp. CBS 124048]